MLCVDRNQRDPYFNLATEEYLLKNLQKDVFMLWQNDPCVVVGKHQNTLAEINVKYVRINKLPVVRRISGGGTVYHDQGNLNFSFIKSGDKDKLVDFKGFTQPIIDALASFGVEANFGGRNNLTIEGRKFSGNAEHVWKNRILHHGTILFNSDLDRLENAITAGPAEICDKAVKSVRSTVTNIQDYLDHAVDMATFKEMIENQLLARYPGTKIYRLTEDDVNEINELVRLKYKTWKWNFGYSPKFTLNRQAKNRFGHFEVSLKIEKGIVEEFIINGSFLTKKECGELEALVIKQPHNPDIILKILEKWNASHSSKISPEEIIDSIF